MRSPRPPVGPLADSPSERAILARVRQLLLDIGCQVYSLSQTRRSHVSAGLPDMYALHARLGGFWIEGKRPGGKQSPAQVAFQHACAAAGVDYLCGGMPEVLDYLERRGLIERSP